MVHSPTLKTIRMVEETLRDMDESLITTAGLKKILPRKVNHNTLLEILEYLEEIHRIVTSVKGITYVYNPSPKMQKALQNATRH
ncbi:hypothetical protein COV93_06610 [Candidatus Woesearchaeota archaeon CG11_big_fil_rev_8_21_14_0_20_43_8]|nr:MAG: hypothetical protein COV93_06610 [Candidatus Woesearchaeota archaeon CG11_big_fil_rev_8_21_14_0_20_43_8]PIO08846.1 MAG: hypothetical protein COT47_00955 [Candidatus Woesearchaeota archaeon CG08_land_8_20_14_0_20_43_7]